EIVGVLFIYSRNRPKLAEELVNTHTARIAEVLTASNSQESLAQLAPPYGADDWTFAIHDSERNLIFERPAKAPESFKPLPVPVDFNWTRREREDAPELVYGSRHLDSGNWVTMAVTGERLPLFGPVFMREAYAHVIVPVAPVIILVLALNVYIVRRMLAPLSAAAAEVDALDPSRMETR